MTSVDDWLRRSWERFARRWWEILGASGVAAAVTLLASALPLGLAAYLAGLRLWSPLTVWGAAVFVSFAAALWLSTWSQAAGIVASASEGDIGSCLRRSWELTAAFAWSLSLVLLAVGGASFLLLLPGLWLAPLLFLAPFITLMEGTPGLAALETSWRRCSGRWSAVAGRLALACFIPLAVGLIPIVGWLAGVVAGPYSLAMLTVLAEELRDTDPGPAAPAPSLALPVAALAVVFLAGTAVSVKAALLAVASLKDLISARVH